MLARNNVTPREGQREENTMEKIRRLFGAIHELRERRMAMLTTEAILRPGFDSGEPKRLDLEIQRLEGEALAEGVRLFPDLEKCNWPLGYLGTF